MLFNPDPSNPAQEVLFSKKRVFKFIQPYVSAKKEKKEQGKQVEYTDLQLPNRLYQVLFFSFYTKLLVQFRS